MEYSRFDGFLAAIARINKFSQIKTEMDWPNFDPIEKGKLEITNGQIEFKDFSLFYEKISEQVQALKSINLSINGGGKVLLCGKSGSGKSTLAVSLLMTRSPETLRGTIAIDGQDLNSVKITSIRDQITIIPQVILQFIQLRKKFFLNENVIRMLNIALLDLISS